VPRHVVKWLGRVFRLIRCGPAVTAEGVLRAWLTDGKPLEALNEGEVANFLLSRGMIDRGTWEEHRRMCLIKMYLGSDPRYARNMQACAAACRVGLDFAKEALRGEVQ
jgi:hypothetical protein